MKLLVEWVQYRGYVDGGVWCLVKGNLQVFAEASEKGDVPRVRQQLQKIADQWNGGAE